MNSSPRPHLQVVPPSGQDLALRQREAAALQALIESLRDSLRKLFIRRSRASARHRGPLHQKLLLGLELLWKIEEQVLLPALAKSTDAATEVRQAGEELDVLRDLALLATQTTTTRRELALAVLEGMSSLHFARGAELLAAAPALGTDWPALEREVRALLSRWRLEVRVHGEIEDEDRDPVGLAPH